jgi:5-methyltetrahydropteroyltriglutamate--homocysteine methyltransferase
MKRSTDRILTTHTGSLARPADLLDLMKARANGEPYDPTAYAARVRDAVADVVRRQVESGLDIVNDGEQSKTGFTAYIRDRLSGFEPASGDAPRPVGPVSSEEEAAFPEYYAEYHKIGYFTTRVAAQPPLVCTGPITYRPQAVETDIENLKAALAGVSVEDVFLPATSPFLTQRNEYYRTQEEYTFAVAEAIREEYLAIVGAGFLLQVDGPGLPRPPTNVSPEEGRKQVDMRIEALNHALRGIPEDKIRFHTCFGINHGPRIFDDSLEQMIGPMLNVHAGAYSFEAANPRHMHEYHVFEKVKVPEGKTIIPGMVTHAHNIVEHPELIAEMIANYARLVGRENVMVGNDCGFSSQAVYQPEVHPTVAWAKFQALAEGARLASGKLWAS